MRSKSLLSYEGVCREDCCYCGGEWGDTRRQCRLRLVHARHYERLMWRGWARCGSLLFRSEARESCCPLLGIRVRVGSFLPSRSQRRLLRRVAPSLEVSVCDASLSREKLELYRAYQTQVHGASHLDAGSFRRAYCVSPFGDDEYGLRHVEFRLERELVAVSVVELLPGALNSCYCFYDRVKHVKMQLGTLSALLEIRLCASMGLEFWSPDFYVHTNSKMNYKSRFRPCELLDPYSGQWVPFDARVKELLDAGDLRLAGEDATETPAQLEDLIGLDLLDDVEFV